MIKARYINHMGDDMTVVDAARVSFAKGHGQYTEEANHRLIRYLAKHQHLSPFGHCFASFHVAAPIFVARQLVKHKFLRWNEISRRYVDEPPVFYFPETWRGRSADKKQGSDGVVTSFVSMFGTEVTPHEVLLTQCDEAMLAYQDLVNNGVAPEQARIVLPANIMTEWYWSGSLDAFANMCRLRCAPDTQYESRLVADQINERMADLFPVSWAALMEME